MNKMNHILLVEDDLNLGFLLMDFLEEEGFNVKLCRDGLAGLDVVQKTHFNLAILDVMMPKMNGFSLAKNIRKRGINMPFLFLTAKAEKSDRLNGYAIGAEDYITKPFDEEELLCKIQVILRRQEEDIYAIAPTEFTLGKFTFNYDRLELSSSEGAHRLTEKENEILRLLCINKNSVLKRDDAVEHIYGRSDYFLGRSFDVYISRLRKLLSADNTLCIENVYKVGFILQEKNKSI